MDITRVPTLKSKLAAHDKRKTDKAWNGWRGRGRPRMCQSDDTKKYASMKG